MFSRFAVDFRTRFTTSGVHCYYSARRQVKHIGEQSVGTRRAFSRTEQSLFKLFMRSSFDSDRSHFSERPVRAMARIATKGQSARSGLPLGTRVTPMAQVIIITALPTHCLIETLWNTAPMVQCLPPRHCCHNMVTFCCQVIKSNEEARLFSSGLD